MPTLEDTALGAVAAPSPSVDIDAIVLAVTARLEANARSQEAESLKVIIAAHENTIAELNRELSRLRDEDFVKKADAEIAALKDKIAAWRTVAHNGRGMLSWTRKAYASDITLRNADTLADQIRALEES